MENCTRCSKNWDNTIFVFLFCRTIEPGNKSNRRFIPFDKKLILQGNGNTVKRANSLSRPLEVLIQTVSLV